MRHRREDGPTGQVGEETTEQGEGNRKLFSFGIAWELAPNPVQGVAHVVVVRHHPGKALEDLLNHET